MSSIELAKWEAFFQLEPFGPIAMNLNFGRLVALFINYNRGKGALPIKATDAALGYFEETAVQQDPEDMLKMLKDMIRK